MRRRAALWRHLVKEAPVVKVDIQRLIPAIAPLRAHRRLTRHAQKPLLGICAISSPDSRALKLRLGPLRWQNPPRQRPLAQKVGKLSHISAS